MNIENINDFKCNECGKKYDKKILINEQFILTPYKDGYVLICVGGCTNDQSN